MDIDTISADKLKKAIADALAHLEKATEALPFLLSLTSEERQHSSGKLKRGEPDAIGAILHTVEKHPAPFASLHLDASAIGDLLQRREQLQPLVDQAQHLADDLSDTLLHLGEAVKGPSSSAYHIAVALAPHDAGIAHDIQPARQFYQAVGRSAARSRKAHEASAPKSAS